MQYGKRWSQISLAVLLLAVSGCQPVRPLPAGQATPATAAAQAAPAPSTAGQVAGRYEGSLSVAGQELTIVVNLAGDATGYTGTIDIPQQGATGIPLHDIRVEPPAVHFEMLTGPQLAVFDGTIGAEGAITGKFTQSGYEGVFALTAATAASPSGEPAAEAASTPEATTAGVEKTYSDPQGRFSAPVPTNWTVTEQDGYVLLTDPDASIKLYLLAVESDDMEKAIGDAWQKVAPGFALEIDKTLEPPSRPGSKRRCPSPTTPATTKSASSRVSAS